MQIDRAPYVTTVLILAALIVLVMPRTTLAAGETAPAADNGCTLQAPAPLLLPHAYAGQTSRRGRENSLVESALLANGMRLEIRRSACVDAVATQVVLTAPGTRADDQAAIALLRATVGKLKWDSKRAGASPLIAFLARAPGLHIRKGARSVCNDGSVADPGACAWDSNGGFDLVVERRGASTRISVTATISA